MGGMLGCLACNAASCAASTACQCCSAACPNNNATLGRVMFVVIFALTSFGAWAMSMWAPDILHWIPVIKICEGNSCMGAMAVYRITFALAIFHFVFALITIGVSKANDFRFQIQNGFWAFKFVALLALIVVSFVIPNAFFKYWGWFSLFGSALFVFVQMVLLVDFAHTWSNSWTRKWEDSESKLWFYLLLTATVLLYVAALVLTILMYTFMCSKCDRNVLFVTFNLCFALLYTFLSINPKVQLANNYRSGLMQAAVVSAFTSYLVFSAIMSEPEKWDCNPWSTSSSNTTSMVLGALFVIVAVCYSAFTTSTSDWIGQEDTEAPHESEPLVPKTDDEASPSSVNADAPVSDSRITYSVSMFHVAFATGAMYVGMLLTSWQVITQTDSLNVKVDSSVASVWVKMASSWITVCLYLWTVLAPILLPNREWN